VTVHLRQICLVARELEPIVEQLSHILGLQVCHRDPVVRQYGLENVLFPIGTDFLEVIAPIEDNTAAGRYLNRLGRNGGYMVITQVDSEETQQAIKARAIEARVRIAHEEKRDGWSFCQLHPADLEAAFLDLEFDEEVDYQGCWYPAGGRSWRQFLNEDNPIQLTEVELLATDPVALTRLWRNILGPSIDDSECTIKLANSRLNFRQTMETEYPCLNGLTLMVRNKDDILSRAIKLDCDRADNQIEICGTQFYLRSFE